MGNKFTSELFDEFRNYQNPTLVHTTDIMDKEIDTQIIPTNCFLCGVNERKVVEILLDYDSYVPKFGWTSNTKRIKHTFNTSKQSSRVSHRTNLIKRFKSPYPALHIVRIQEDVAVDTIFSNTSTIDSGPTMAQFYCSTESLL